MVKILRTVPFYAPAFGYGGPVVHTYNVSKIQASMGYDVRVFTTNILTHKSKSDTLPKFELMDEVKVHRFPIKYRLGDSHYFITPQLPIGFLNYDYDLIHSHSFRTFQTDISTLFAKLRKKPFVFTAHGTLRKMYLLNLFKDKNKGAMRMKVYDKILKHFFLNVVDRVIVHSEHEKKWSLNFNVPEEKIRVIPHGVDIEKFSDLNLKQMFVEKYKPEGKMILYVGRLLRNYRNIEDLIHVMKDIESDFKDVKLWLIGRSYDERYEKDLRHLVKSLELENRVIFVTNPTRDDIIGAYQYANIMVFPMTDSDGFGIPLLEAGASKTPVITTNIGPGPELVKDNETGLLTSINNRQDLNSAMSKLLADENIERKMGMKAYNHIKKNYNWSDITKRTNALYEELL